MRARETNPRQSLNLAEPLEQCREIAAGIVGRLVVIHDLPEQLHFPGAGRHGMPRVGNDVGDRPHPFMPARVRHDAERAEFVAALDDRHVRLDRIAPARNPQRKRHVVHRIERDSRLMLM